MFSVTLPRIAIRLLAAAATVLSLTLAAQADQRLTVFAAASLKNAMDDVANAWEARTGNAVTVSYAGSSALARQIRQGAPADIFISANVDWMDALEADGLIRPGSRRDLLTNEIVLIAHGRNAKRVEIGPGLDLRRLLGDGRLAMALVDAVPAGIYGRSALENLGLWASVRDRVAQADNVRAALALVAFGEAPYGIVYRTDAAADDNVTVAGIFPASSHAPIVYPAAATADSANPQDDAFLDFLAGDEAGRIFGRYGFGPIE